MIDLGAETGPAVTRVSRILLVVGDLDAAARFFTQVFDFQPVDRRPDPHLACLLGAPAATIRQSILRLGAQEIGLLAFDPPARPYPPRSTSTDLWFQHFAIIVSDMAAAIRRLETGGGFTPISMGGPQALPPRSGGATAFKFRDADGHPLELLAFPSGEAPDPWRDEAKAALFLGIDHSAIAVADTDRSVAFYQTCLGLRLGAQTRNEGPEQSRLDAVPGAIVTVTGLKPRGIATPHVELLGYGVGLRRPIASETHAGHRAATTIVMQTKALDAIVAALRAAEARFVSPGVVALDDGAQAIACLDPDGHRIVVVQPA